MTKRPNSGGGGNGGANEHCPEKVRFLFIFLLVIRFCSVARWSI